MKLFRSVWPVIAAVTLVASVTSGAGAVTPGGTQISNTVEATYSDGNGGSFTTISNTVVTTVAAISGVGVTPNENGCNPATDDFAVGTNVSRTFTITNNSNITDSYALTAATSAGSVASIAIVSAGTTTPIANGATAPALAPGGALQVIVTVNTAAIPVGSTTEVSLTATSTSTGSTNGQASSTASQCAIAVGKAVIAGPGGATTQVSKLIDGEPFEAVKAGQTVTYSIAFENYGGIPATNAVLTDVFPAGVTPSLSSVSLNGTTLAGGATLNGQTLTVALGTLAPTTLYTLTVTATISSTATLGSELVNTASVTSANVSTPAVSSPAAALVGVANVVYDGYAGSSLPVPGSVVTLVNPTTLQPIALGGTPLAPNTNNADPYTTGTGGTYAFGLGAGQIGPVTYDIIINAPGYLARKIQVVLTPDATGTYYSVTLTALDGQLLAVPGGFALTAGPVTIPEVSGLFGNLPLFRAQSIQITKTVDRTVASGGDRLVYTIQFSNISTPLGAATLLDTLPTGVVYAPGTALVDGTHVEPKIAGKTLTWTFPTLASSHTVKYATIVQPGMSAGQTLTNVATVSAAAPNDPAVRLSATASVDTYTIAGLFSDQTIIVGRVFVDLTGDGWFHKNDTGLANVRIYMEDGESVVTDSNGRYSFPGVRPGMHVLKIDRSTLPPGTKPYDVHDYDDQKSIRRLVHGVFDGGVIQDVNFAIEPVK